jgi:hypothetical protein
MKLERFLLYGLAALSGLYVLAAVLYAIPMITGLLDDSMEVKFDRPNPAIVADYGNGLTPPAEGSFYHEAIRDLVRARLAAVRVLRQARQQLSSFLLRHGHHYHRPA